MKKTHILIILFFFIILLSFAAVSNNKKDEYQTVSFQIKKILQTKNPQQALTYFHQAFKESKDKKIYHRIAHFLGAQLFENEETKGIIYCDDTAGYGCFHGFFIKALEKHGKDLFSQAINFCTKEISDRVRKAECVHGIGHGFLALSGYKEDQLKEALDNCKNLIADTFLRNICYSGIYMEYNLRTMTREDNESYIVREFKKDTPYEPCLDLPVEFQPGCFYELPYWWLHLFGNDFINLDNLCQKTQNASLREYCYRGIGHIVPWAASYDLQKIISYCHNLKEIINKRYCLEDASKLIFYKNDSPANNLCESLPPAHKNLCLSNLSKFQCDVIKSC